MTQDYKKYKRLFHKRNCCVRACVCLASFDICCWKHPPLFASILRCLGCTSTVFKFTSMPRYRRIYTSHHCPCHHLTHQLTFWAALFHLFCFGMKHIPVIIEQCGWFSAVRVITFNDRLTLTSPLQRIPPFYDMHHFLTAVCLSLVRRVIYYHLLWLQCLLLS